jgi:AcrR family transcriptional regulator
VGHEASSERGAGTARTTLGGLTSRQQPLWAEHLAGALGVSKAAIYYHYRSKDALLRHLTDPLLDAIDTCINAHNAAPGSARTARQLLSTYLAVLTTHREIMTWVATDVAVAQRP